MAERPDLPKTVADMIVAANYIEFATLSKAGTPIDTPLLSFAKLDLSTIGLTTGLAYPAKAERLRRNPSAGLWIDGRLPGEPTVAIIGHGAVYDADIKANAVEYIAETAAYGAGASADWSLEQKSVWYWSRMMMRVAPSEILWWDSAAALDDPPHRWTASADMVWPTSDPAPGGEPTPASEWRRQDWETLAENALKRNGVGHLSLVDEHGFPRPMVARDIERVPGGFVVTPPRFMPGARSGPASLSFQGLENFLGAASEEDGRVRLKVDRALPLLPLMNDPKELWEPSAETRKALMSRLEAELALRGQSMPRIPAVKPEPTEGAILRRDRVERMKTAGRFVSAGPGRGWSTKAS